MGAVEPTLIGGFLLGLASTLHCSAMCGAISCSALLTLGPTTPADRLRHMALLNFGRLLSYSALGATAAVAGAALVLPNSEIGYHILQWIGAAVLMWTGLSLAGLMPRLALLDGAMLRVSEAVSSATRSYRGGPGVLSPVLFGVIWGFNPCPMVYGAIFTAALTGSAMSGAAVMAAFALGTLPGVVAAGLGLSALSGMNTSRVWQGAAGLAIASVGVASLYAPALPGLALCLTR